MDMETPVLEIRGLTKSYGPLKALDNFSLTVRQGEVVGILGPNGSGKTTTLGILLDILKQDGGEFFWFGRKPEAKQRMELGALLENPSFYPHLSGLSNLKIIADIKEIPYTDIDRVIDMVGLSERKHSKFKTYSLGMKQRLAIASALLGKPRVLILDEPTNGLDPKGIAEIRSLIQEIGKTGVTIILASHLLDEVQKVCTHVVIINKGKKAGEGKVAEVLGDRPAIELSCADNRALEKVLVESRMFEEVYAEDEMVIATIRDRMPPSELNRYLTSKGIYLDHLAMRKQSLEKYFLGIIKQRDV